MMFLHFFDELLFKVSSLVFECDFKVLKYINMYITVIIKNRSETKLWQKIGARENCFKKDNRADG